MEVDGLGGQEAVLTADAARLRIACSGVVGAENGSVASAGFLVLKELLRRGHEVDFFSKHSYVYPERLIEHPCFKYHACDQPRLDNLVAHVSYTYGRWLALQTGNAVYMRRIIRAMARQHATRLYDSILFLGQWAYGRVARLPVVSWVQGPPGTDSRSLLRHGTAIRGLCGWNEYAKLRGYACYRGSRVGRPPFRHTDICICGSRSSTETLVTRFGLSPGRVRELPYPIDLDAFKPATASRDTAPLEMLWVGRIVPRKRLDLFLEAGERLIGAGTDLHLTVIGDFPFAAGYRTLIDHFPYPAQLTYLREIPQREVRRRMQGASVLVQPSEEENFGSSVAEALACGTPVVLGPSNGTGDYMGEGGARFSEYLPSAVAEATSRVLNLPAERVGRIRAEARKAAVAHFAADRVVDQLEATLREAQSMTPESAWQPR